MILLICGGWLSFAVITAVVEVKKEVLPFPDLPLTAGGDLKLGLALKGDFLLWIRFLLLESSMSFACLSNF